MADALGVASTRAAGSLQLLQRVHEDRSPTRTPCLSLPGEVGVRAILLAQRGIACAGYCLEGPQGLCQVYCGGRWDRALMSGGQGEQVPATAVGSGPWPPLL